MTFYAEVQRLEEECRAQADRIEELEQQNAKLVEALEQIASKLPHYPIPCRDVYVRNIAADALKGIRDE